MPKVVDLFRQAGYRLVEDVVVQAQCVNLSLQLKVAFAQRSDHVMDVHDLELLRD